jgi:hypothetical protein
MPRKGDSAAPKRLSKTQIETFQIELNRCAFTVFYCSMDDMLVGISGHSSAAGA